MPASLRARALAGNDDTTNNTPWSVLLRVSPHEHTKTILTPQSPHAPRRRRERMLSSDSHTARAPTLASNARRLLMLQARRLHRGRFCER